MGDLERTQLKFKIDKGLIINWPWKLPFCTMALKKAEWFICFHIYLIKIENSIF